MKLNGVHHVSINVLDVERATAFYVEKLGMRILPRPEIGVAGVWLGAGSQEVHLIASDDPTRAPGQHFAASRSAFESNVPRLLADATSNTCAISGLKRGRALAANSRATATGSAAIAPRP